MKYTTAQNHLSQLTKRCWLLSLLSGGLLLCVMLLILFIFMIFHHRQTILVPMGFDQSAVVSEQSVSPSYLTQVATAFLADRLNVTPATIDASQQRLLRYVSPRAYPALKKRLELEAAAIKQDKVSSYFDIANLVPLPHGLGVMAQGTLIRFVGTRQLAPVKRTYRLTFAYQASRLWLTGFNRVEAIPKTSPLHEEDTTHA